MIERVQLRADGDARVDLSAIAAEFPSLRVDGTDGVRAHRGDDAGQVLTELEIDAITWMDSASRLLALDEEVARAAEAGPVWLRIFVGAAGDRTRLALSVLTRYQRFAQRRNFASRTAAFEIALRKHRALHDLRKPLVRADFDHSLDAWQWLLRLRPDAALAPQLATLFLDAERLASEPEPRIDHRAMDYLAYKTAHARRGAQIAMNALDGCGLPSREVLRAMELVSAHEQPGASDDLALVNDADALSFLSLNSPSFIDYFGPAHTRKKALYTLRRLSPNGRARLDAIGLRPDVARIVEDAARSLAAEATATSPSNRAVATS